MQTLGPEAEIESEMAEMTRMRRGQRRWPRPCGKKRYRSKDQAMRVRDQILACTGDFMEIYICGRCLAFHLGHKRPENVEGKNKA